MTIDTNTAQFSMGPQGGIFLYEVHQDRSVSPQGMIPYYEPKSFPQMDRCVKEGNLCYRYENKYVMMSAKDAQRLKLGKPVLLTWGLQTFKALNQGDAVLGARPDQSLKKLNQGSLGGNQGGNAAKSSQTVKSPPPDPNIHNNEPPTLLHNTQGSAAGDALSADQTAPKAGSSDVNASVVASNPVVNNPPPVETKAPWFAAALNSTDPMSQLVLTFGVKVFGKDPDPKVGKLLEKVLPLAIGSGFPV